MISSKDSYNKWRVERGLRPITSEKRKARSFTCIDDAYAGLQKLAVDYEMASVSALIESIGLGDLKISKGL